MINWDEFEHIHVIKKLKQILSSWWNIDIIFTDERGHLRGVDPKTTKFCNPAVNIFLNKESAADSLAETISKSIEDLRMSENRYSIRKWDTAGFDIAIVPILIDNDFMGTVVAMGFVKDVANSGQRLNEVREAGHFWCFS